MNDTSIVIEFVNPPDIDIVGSIPGPRGPQGEGVPVGGTAGQVLAKTSSTDFETEWVTPYSGTPVETVAGSTPIINASPGHRYICGEVSTLDIALPASGIVDVVFASGSTATVLNISLPVGVPSLKWSDGWDGTCEANTMYEINILNGMYGVRATWT